MQPVLDSNSYENEEEDEYPVVAFNKEANASFNNVRMFTEKTEGASEILFEYLGEIEDFIFKTTKT